MQYQPLEIEKILLAKQFQSDRLTVLERKSMARTQYYFHKHKTYIKSISDEYRYLRIVLIAIFQKIYRSYSTSNQKLLNQIKTLIYNAKLVEMDESKGLQRQQLLTIVASQFKKLKVNEQVQYNILHMFNCVAFVDQIFMRALIENMNYGKSQVPDISFVNRWVKDELNLDVKGYYTNLQDQRPNELYLSLVENIMMREAYKQVELVETESEGEAQTPERTSKNQEKLLQTISIHDSSSPYSTEKKKLKENINTNHKIQEDDVRPFRPHSKKRQNQQRKSLWSIFCCKDD